MLGTIAAGGNVLALLQSRLAALKAKDPNDPKADDRKVADDDRLRSAQEALNAMKSVSVSRKAQRKAAAQEKVERLKKELEVLRMAGVMADPKAVARRAKQIARELAAAAREYASAGGSGGALGSGAALATPAGAEAGAKGQAPTAAGAEQAAAQAEAAANKATDKPVPRTPEDERKATAQVFQTIVGEMQAQGAERKADSTFAADVRAAYQQVRLLMAQQRRRAEAMGDKDPEMAQLARSVREAGNDIEFSLTGGAGKVLALVDIQV